MTDPYVPEPICLMYVTSMGPARRRAGLCAGTFDCALLKIGGLVFRDEDGHGAPISSRSRKGADFAKSPAELEDDADEWLKSEDGFDFPDEALDAVLRESQLWMRGMLPASLEFEFWEAIVVKGRC